MRGGEHGHARLTGPVAAVDSTTAVVDVNGIGFAVRMPNADLATLHIGNAAVVHTEMSSVLRLSKRATMRSIWIFSALPLPVMASFDSVRTSTATGPPPTRSWPSLTRSNRSCDHPRR